MPRFRITLTMESGLSESFLIDRHPDGLCFSDIAVQAEERWTPHEGDTLKIEELEDDDEAA